MNDRDLINAFTDNIRHLPIEPITIATTTGPHEVGALLLGDWALNRNKEGWAATHQRTGRTGKSYPTPIEALISLGIRLGAGLRIPTELTIAATEADFESLPDFEAIRARIKSATDVLASWGLDLDYNEKEVDL